MRPTTQRPRNTGRLPRDTRLPCAQHAPCMVARPSREQLVMNEVALAQARPAPLAPLSSAAQPPSLSCPRACCSTASGLRGRGPGTHSGGVQHTVACGGRALQPVRSVAAPRRALLLSIRPVASTANSNGHELMTLE